MLSLLSVQAADRRFTVVSPYGSKGLSELGFINNDGDFKKLKWSQQRRSQEYIAPRTGDITLVKPHLNADGRTIYQPVLELPWPGDTDLALFVVVLVDGVASPKVFGIDDRKESFPENTLLVLNGLNQTIYALAGETQFQLKPGRVSKPFMTDGYHFVDQVIVQEDEEKAEPNPGMPIAVGIEENGEYDLIYAAGVSVNPGSRVLCMVLPPKKLGSMRYQARMLLH